VNQVRYRSEEYDALFEELRVETDANRQIDLFIEMNDHLIDNNVLVPMVAVAERSACAVWLNEESIQLGPFNMEYWNIANWYGDPPS
jgi:peptide/nickel transport system substrate-binding protein